MVAHRVIVHARRVRSGRSRPPGAAPMVGAAEGASAPRTAGASGQRPRGPWRCRRSAGWNQTRRAAAFNEHDGVLAEGTAQDCGVAEWRSEDQQAWLACPLALGRPPFSGQAAPAPPADYAPQALVGPPVRHPAARSAARRPGGDEGRAVHSPDHQQPINARTRCPDRDGSLLPSIEDGEDGPGVGVPQG